VVEQAPIGVGARTFVDPRRKGRYMPVMHLRHTQLDMARQEYIVNLPKAIKHAMETLRQ
jgi:hypothetical protein